MQVPKIVKKQVTVQRVVEVPREVPQIQYVDEIVDVPVRKERRVPMIQKITKEVEIRKERRVPMISKVQKTVQVPQIEVMHLRVRTLYKNT